MKLLEWRYGNRTFKVNDRVKAYYEGRWYAGTIISFSYMRDGYPKWMMSKEMMELGGYIFIEEIETEKGTRIVVDHAIHAHALIQTDILVENSEGLLDGYGLQSTISGTHLIFEYEDEYEPSPFVIRTIEPNDDLDLPF